MKTILTLFFSLIALTLQAQNTITISGRVTDFEGSPIDSCKVTVLHPDFSTAYGTYSDKGGYYAIPNVKKGKYAAIIAMRPKEYPRPPEVPEQDMRLEYWAWNVIADSDLVINPRYHRLELYGTTVFKEHGGYPSLMIYTRPMSLGRMLTNGEDVYKDKSKLEQPQVDLSAEPEDIEFHVWADDAPLTIRSVQPVDEWVGGGRQKAYLLYVDLPVATSAKYVIFRVAAFNRAYGGEWGENVFFYELPKYQ